MLVSVGRRRPPTDILDTILGCHARIRTHVGIAARLAVGPAPDEAQVADAASRVSRYFCEGLPRHILDEEKSLLPRLLGRSHNLDQVLASMQEQHRAHEARIERLVAICDGLQCDPTRLEELRAGLSDVASKLFQELDEHLTLEERVVFPAARGLLNPLEKASLAEELRRRHRALETRPRVAAG